MSARPLYFRMGGPAYRIEWNPVAHRRAVVASVSVRDTHAAGDVTAGEIAAAVRVERALDAPAGGIAHRAIARATGARRADAKATRVADRRLGGPAVGGGGTDADASMERRVASLAATAVVRADALDAPTASGITTTFIARAVRVDKARHTHP